MKLRSWQLLSLALAVLPSCLLVQPLDDAKSEPSNGGGGAAGNSAGGGGGQPNEVDFSLFTGTWIIKSGQFSVTCDEQTTTEPATPGETSNVGLGTTSDLIIDPGTACPVLLDVDDREAVAQAGQTCTFTEDGAALTFSIDYFDFIVTAADTSATSSFYASATTANGVLCNIDQNLYFER